MACSAVITTGQGLQDHPYNTMFMFDVGPEDWKKKLIRDKLIDRMKFSWIRELYNISQWNLISKQHEEVFIFV